MEFFSYFFCIISLNIIEFFTILFIEKKESSLKILSATSKQIETIVSKNLCHK